MTPATLADVFVGCAAGAGAVLLSLAYVALRVGFSPMPATSEAPRGPASSLAADELQLAALSLLGAWLSSTRRTPRLEWRQ